jgi:hypothetical protein
MMLQNIIQGCDDTYLGLAMEGGRNLDNKQTKIWTANLKTSKVGEGVCRLLLNSKDKKPKTKP